MCLDLKHKYCVSGEKAEKDFCTWLDKVHLLNEEHQHDIRHTTRVCEDVVGQMGRFPRMPTGSNSFAGPSANPLKDSIRLPVLTAEERALLNTHRGCYKCRQFYQPHGAHDCPNGFPDGKGYKMLTEADAQAVATKAPKHLGKPKAVAVIKDTDEDTSVSVIMPSVILSNGTDSEEECIAPLSVPHLQWSCVIDRPLVSSPILVKALIDHGSTIVLIDQMLVTQLGLHRHRLEKPKAVRMAMSGRGEQQNFSLTEYVKLSCMSPDSLFTSKTHDRPTEPKNPVITAY
jgi:hypothetical protein